MHEAVFSCLVAKEEASYSAYLSYRTASDSEALLARLLFDELNHRSTVPLPYACPDDYSVLCLRGISPLTSCWRQHDEERASGGGVPGHEASAG
jgi:hypothetical protein